MKMNGVHRNGIQQNGFRNGMDIDHNNGDYKNDGNHNINIDDNDNNNNNLFKNNNNLLFEELNRSRNYNDMMSLEKNGITSFELNEDKLNLMIKEKEVELSGIIPTCYNDANHNKISVIHPLRLFAKDGTEDSKKGIIEESYTEIEFIDPYYAMYEKLIIGPHKLIENHPFEHHWKHRVIKIAENEQLLIDKISSTHKQLLKKLQAANEEYQQLLLKQEQQ